MAPAWSHLLHRDASPSGSGTTATAALDTGAIAGISCAAGALFLGSVGLFIIYWRRQRRYDQAEQVYYPRAAEEKSLFPKASPVYTMDYKMDPETSTNSGSSSAYTYSPEVPASDPFPHGGMVGAMPAHPAYIPRALVRGVTPTMISAPSASPTPSRISNQAPPAPRAARSKSRPDDYVMQAYLRAADGERVASSVFRLASSPPEGERESRGRTHSRESAPSSPVATQSHPHHPHPQAQPPQGKTQGPVPSIAVPTRLAAARSKQYSPPRMNLLDRAIIAKRETEAVSDMDISAPMEVSPIQQQQKFEQARSTFLQNEQQQQQQQTVAIMMDRRTFAERSLSRDREPQPQYQNRYIHQVEVPRDSDIW
ncbi:hypothetical protein B0T25DRAFT_110441 [Lasiosphaeria hispida]|uniref:Uncharacterized protein n=1 Tax=Lasiosphaeria hispida TaxID=260671 RepID=A0AAJ0MI50_9PEZI|nr:hypothetical protein B0T25DRAFT_110441 [Lasiosphaeria hispida]